MYFIKTVGIIGDLGPETTAEFYLDIISSCHKKDKITRPSIIIASIPLPLQIEEDLILRNKGAERYLPFLIKEAQRLEKAGTEFIVMPCNSLHIFINEIRNAVSVPVLSIIDETVQHLKQNNMNKVGIISTSTTVKSKLYENAFSKNNIGYVAPNESQQNKIDRIILDLLAGHQKDEDRNELANIINNFDEKNLDCVILACTDLQLLKPHHPALKIYDTMKIFSDATVRKIL
ncbi:MAG: hypothetical protein CO042_00080 [Parcubacteria group bacterium CG_4_9_14_0_2_um_filter_41_8]|nr:MAG: hypothetical protein CO042_00080 [Parcubacteria group bacterium CG_4_9_14_0_2_um_filter_41_8]